MRLRAALLLSSIGFAAFASAQHNPDSERGARPGLAYRVEGLDHVNLFNGTVTSNIPLGQTFSINGTLSYGFMASYATNAWDSGTNENCYFDSDGYHCDEYPYQYPASATNAGLGWMVNLGRLSEKDETGMVYTAADGGEHTLFFVLHDANPDETVDETVMYTRDGTYLRLKRTTATSLSGILEFPSGERHTFDSSGRLTRMEDRFGNWVSVAYALQSSTDVDFNSQPVWTISDSIGREHQVYFRRSWSHHEDLWGENVPHSVVDRVVLAAYKGTTAKYQFTYDALPTGATTTPPNTPDPALSTSRLCLGRDDPNTPNYIYVPLLRSITLPDNSQYAFDIDRGDRTGCSRPPFGGISGSLTRMTLPTGGSVDWTYQPYLFYAISYQGVGNISIRQSYNVGIKSRATSLGGRTEYELGVVNASDLWTDVSRTVKNFDGGVLLNQTRHYFNACRAAFGCSDGRSVGEYGLPFSRTATPATGQPTGGGFVSAEMQELVNGELTPRRITYVLYEYDHPSLARPTPANQRVKYERTVYLDDGGRYADVTYSLFDGLGHYRKAATGGNFARKNVRTTFTNYDKVSGTFEFDSSGNLVGGFIMPSTSSSWILNTYSRQSASEETQRFGQPASIEVTDVGFCFDANGFLTSRRTYKTIRADLTGLPTVSSEDFLAVFERETSTAGLLRLIERYYRGQQAFTCGASVPAGEDYQVSHEYENGAVARSWYNHAGGSAMTFFNADAVIDRNTGLPVSARRFRTNAPNTTDGALTEYSYDALGRPTEVKTSTATVTYTYSMLPPVITTSERASDQSLLRWSSIEFDALGRALREQRQMPDGSTAEKGVGHNSLGWVTSVTDWGATAPTQYKHDGFGRTIEIRTPDLTSDLDVTRISYTGAAKVERTTRVATGGTVTTPVLTAAVTTEEYDRHGRLIGVVEPAQSVGGARPRTEYTYDSGGRLVEVCSNQTGTVAVPGCGQMRTFAYDGRGVLTEETHPES